MPRKHPFEAKEPASPEQIRLIDQFRSRPGNPHHMPRPLLERWLGVSQLEDLSVSAASELIESLMDDEQRAAIREQVLSQDMESLAL